MDQKDRIDENQQNAASNKFVERFELDDAPPTAVRPPKPAIPVNSKVKEDSRMELYDWLQCIVGALLIGVFVFMFIGRQVQVDGDSMLPTLHNGDRIITSRMFYSP